MPKMQNCACVFLVAGAMMLMPGQWTGDLVGFDDVLANNAGGNGNGKGQGSDRAGSAGGSVASAGSKAKSLSDPLHASKLGRVNAVLYASSSAWKNASENSPIGMIAQTYTNALLGYFGTDDPTLQETSLDDAAAILAKVANKDEITIEMVGAINARIAAENQDNPTLAALAPTDDLTIATTSTQLATDLAGRATALQQQESDQGLGPIY